MRTARRVSYRIILLDFALEPRANTRCSVTLGGETRSLRSNQSGIVHFKVADPLTECHVSWLATEDADVPIVREITFEDSVQSRLNNLGYADVEPDDDNAELCFLREFGLSEDMTAEERNQAIIKWHDLGQKPSAGEA